MANFEVLSLDPTTPQIRAPGAGDGYSVPRNMTFASGTNLTLSGGTANGVLYLNGSKVATSGSTLTFDGTNLGVGGNAEIGLSTSSGYAVIGLISATTGSARYGSIRKNYDSPFDLRIRASNSATAVPLVFDLSSSTEAARFDTSGNLGLGVTPSAWNTGALQIRNASFWGLSGSPTFSSVGANYYYDGTYKYISTAQATDYYQFLGQHVWRTAASGTAGNAITFTQAMTLNASGDLGLGTTTPSYRLDVQAPTNTLARIGGSGTGQAGFYIASGGAFNPFISFRSSASTVEAGIYAVAGSAALVFATGSSDTERARITAAGNLLVGTTSSVGSTTNIQPIVAGRFRTAGNSTSIASTGVATTVLTFNSDDGDFLVSMRLAGTGAPATDDAVAIVCVNGGSATKTDLKTGANMVISVSGLNLQATQNLFAGANVNWSVIRISS